MQRRGFDSRGMFRTSNPALRDDLFRGLGGTLAAPGTTMTVQGAVNKTAALLLLLMFSAASTWVLVDPVGNIPLLIGTALVGFVIAMATIFRPRWSPYTAPVYALVEGVFLGMISEAYETAFSQPGIVLQAIGATVAVFATMLFLFKARIIRVTQRFRAVVLTATLGIALFYLVSIVLSLFGARVPFINDASPIGILISVVIVGVAALNLVLDFDFIERGAQGGAPGYMEWYGAFGLLVTLVWLYLELLRLLSKLRR
jgi:uncharacterized YccA/Bax inhibitor family protein